MIISVGAEKAFDRIQYAFNIKASERKEIEGSYLNIIKAVFGKLTATIILMGKSQSSSTKIRSKTRVSAFSPLMQVSTRRLS